MIGVCSNISAKIFGKNLYNDEKRKFCQLMYKGVLHKRIELNKEGVIEMTKEAKEMKNSDKFDVVIGNPPYKGKGRGLHLRFLELAFNFLKESGSLSFIHPATWLISKKNNQFYSYMRNLVSKSVIDFTFLNPDTVFGVEMSMPVVITNLIKNNGLKEYKVIDKIFGNSWFYSSIHDINIFGNYPEYFSLCDKILPVASKNSLHDNIGKNGKYYVILPKITGHLDKKSLYRDDFFTLCNSVTHISKNKDKNGLIFGFNSKKEAVNFINYIKSKFARFALSIYKFNKNIHMGELRAVPWLDFSKYYTDKNLCDMFGVTSKELVFIDTIIPDYHKDKK